MGRGASRPEDAASIGLESIDEPRRQRVVGANDRQIDALLTREREQALDVRDGKRCILSKGSGAGVAWRAINLPDIRRAREFPGQRVFASAAADDEQVHGGRFTNAANG